MLQPDNIQGYLDLSAAVASDPHATETERVLAGHIFTLAWRSAAKDQEIEELQADFHDACDRLAQQSQPTVANEYHT